MVNINSTFRVTTAPWGQTAPSKRTGVIIHHSVTAEGGSVAGVEAQLRGINRQHPYGAYNYAVDYLGNIWEIAGLHNIGGHAYNNNTANWGICYIGDGRYNFTAAAESSIKEMVAYLQGQAGKNLSIRGHGQVNATACPGGIIQGRINAGAFGSGYVGPATGGGSGKSTETIKKYQARLIELGYDLAPWGADGQHGAKTNAAVKAFQKKNGLVDDGIVGPLTSAALFGRPTALPPTFPLPAKWYFGPASGPRESVSGYHGNREHLRTWQQRMIDRGWHFAHGADGLYGPETEANAKSFQTEKGLKRDGLIGPDTWYAAWTAPIT